MGKYESEFEFLHPLAPQFFPFSYIMKETM